MLQQLSYRLKKYVSTGYLNMMRAFPFLLFFFPVHAATAQIDSLYIQPFEQNFSLRTYFIQHYTSVFQDFSVDGHDDFEYRTNRPVSIGLGISWNNSSISGSYGFPFLRDRKKGKTHTLAFQYHYYGRKLVFDFAFQKHKGMYKFDGEDESVFEVTPDTKVSQYGVTGQYVFNGNRFSYKAAFDLSEVQLRSVGSFILGGSLYKNRIDAEGPIIVTNPKGKTDSISEIQKNIQIGVNVGYAYSWVIKKRFFAAVSMTVGFNVGTESINKLHSKPELYPSFNPRVALGYHGKEWSVSTSFFDNHVYTFYSDNMSRGISTMSLQMTIVKRFGKQPRVFDRVPNIPSLHNSF
ncbi:DUF4421 family protein [Dysgonomonas macrotermitis]|uniref:DUF4421 domain-containing protein n=1 Tax=Dysgonomonas macrotermitis TaxID=1346286 RepID=A0A1M5HHW9_9BACT|nr:DUF4421 family protein [Dysgonomonas macrotermitis]SHG15550.1 protein of unknown function [Dysgonomonas macrotermitis]